MPVRSDARHELAAGEIGAQPLAGEKLQRLDQGAAIAALAAGEPSERRFGGIDCQRDAPIVGLDLRARQPDMLAEERIDGRAAARKLKAQKMRATGLGDHKGAIATADGQIGRNEDVSCGWARDDGRPRGPFWLDRMGRTARKKAGEQALSGAADPVSRGRLLAGSTAGAGGRGKPWSI